MREEPPRDCVRSVWSREKHVKVHFSMKETWWIELHALKKIIYYPNCEKKKRNKQTKTWMFKKKKNTWRIFAQFKTNEFFFKFPSKNETSPSHFTFWMLFVLHAIIWSTFQPIRKLSLYFQPIRMLGSTFRQSECFLWIFSQSEQSRLLSANQNDRFCFQPIRMIV